MMSVLYLLICALIPVQADWTWYTFPESGFKILAPYTLVDNVRQVNAGDKVIDYHQYHGGSVKDSLLSMAFVIDHYIFPATAEELDDTSLQVFFTNSIEPVVNAIHGEVVYRDMQRQAGRAVCEWKALYDQGAGVIRGTSMLYENQYYGLSAFGLTEHKPEEDMNRFLSSFQLLESRAKSRKSRND